MNDDDMMEINKDLCNNCGKCVGACHFDCVTEEKVGYKIMVGGAPVTQEFADSIGADCYTADAASAAMAAAEPHSAWHPPWAPETEARSAMTIPKAPAVNRAITQSCSVLP